ncbi:late embryogenesis abundant protein At1g64065-like [Corylus avellana]|uniref:late embryogenesis abundant protein At1g64065-like n=1 Tax=Corylus avellana TaxID=13451 RepID=UPI001E1F9DB0|nr:late embryogenesis abundant protein At1g64065-like [Corylus avellana]
MAEELPFAPSKMCPRSDEEIATFKALKKERSGKCFVYIFAGVVTLSIIVLVFALIVLRVKIPDVKLRSITVKNLKYQGNNSESPSFNATFVAEVTIKNTNFGRFKFDDSTLSVLYGGVNVGDRKMGHGRVKARETQGMNFTVEVRSNRVMDARNLSREIEGGMVKLSSYARLSGRVNLMNIVRKRKITEMNCTMTLDLANHAFRDLRCF